MGWSMIVVPNIKITKKKNVAGIQDQYRGNGVVREFISLAPRLERRTLNLLNVER